MNNIQDKIGMGIFKIQESIDKGKTKVDVMKETSKISQLIEDTSSKKLEKIIEIGMIAHQKIRDGQLEYSDMNEVYKSIVGFDYIIYENRKKLEDLKIQSEGFLCVCGNELSEGFKFCNRCGNKVQLPIDNTNYINCSRCEVSIMENLNFCPCCGVKTDL